MSLLVFAYVDIDMFKIAFSIYNHNDPLMFYIISE